MATTTWRNTKSMRDIAFRLGTQTKAIASTAVREALSRLICTGRDGQIDDVFGLTIRWEAVAGTPDLVDIWICEPEQTKDPK